MNAKDIENGNFGLLEPMTQTRACLLLARMYEYLGNRDKSIEAARIGLKHVGRGGGPKVALQDLLKRLGQPA